MKSVIYHRFRFSKLSDQFHHSKVVTEPELNPCHLPRIKGLADAGTAHLTMDAT